MFRVAANIFGATDGELIWRMIEQLISDGWVISSSGSGSGGAFNAAGNVHSPGGPYAGTLDLANAWFRLRAPATATLRREFLFQRPNTTAWVWRVWYSSDGIGFTGGAPNATTRPTAADEQGILNFPTGTATWLYNSAVNGIFRMDMVIGDVSEQFSFWFGFREIGDWSGYCGGLGLDVLQDAHALDQDPAVVIRFNGAGGSRGALATQFARYGSPCWSGANAITATNSAFAGWYRKGLAGAAFVSFPPNYMGVQVGFPTYEEIGSQKYVGQDSNQRTPRWPVIYTRGNGFATQKGWKGRSRVFYYEILSNAFIRETSDRSRLVMGALSIPWDGATALVV